MVSLGSSVTPRTVLSVDEQSRIKEKLLQDLPDLKNLEDLYYNVASLKFLKSEVPKSKVNSYEKPDLFFELKHL